MSLKYAFILAGLTVAGANSAQAVTITSLTRAQFQAAIGGGVTLQNFDSLTAGTTLGTLNGVTYGASLGTPLVTNHYLTTTNPNGLGSTSIGFFRSSETASFTFAAPISAFAIDVNTFASTDGGYTATLSTGDTVKSIFEVFPNTSTGQFVGFVTNGNFTSVTINANTGYSYTLDTLIYGAASQVTKTPEPGAPALFGLGAFALGLARRRIR